jgi:predicted nucleotidyltransferase
MIDSIKILEITNGIASKFDPEKIIVFGSYANGTQNEESDLDLLIIQESDLPPHERGFDIRMSLRGTKIPFDILIYTKQEFEQEKGKSFSFLHSALQNSKTVYERAE